MPPSRRARARQGSSAPSSVSASSSAEASFHSARSSSSTPVGSMHSATSLPDFDVDPEAFDPDVFQMDTGSPPAEWDWGQGGVGAIVAELDDPKAEAVAGDMIEEIQGIPEDAIPDKFKPASTKKAGVVVSKQWKAGAMLGALLLSGGLAQAALNPNAAFGAIGSSKQAQKGLCVALTTAAAGLPGSTDPIGFRANTQMNAQIACEQAALAGPEYARVVNAALNGKRSARELDQLAEQMASVLLGPLPQAPGQIYQGSKALARIVPHPTSRMADKPNAKALVRVSSPPPVFDRDSGRDIALGKVPGPSRRVGSIDPASKALALIPPTMSRPEDGPNGKALVRVPSVPPLFDRDSGRDIALGKVPTASGHVGVLDPASKALARLHPTPGTSRPARKPNANALVRVPSAPPVFDRGSGRDIALGKVPTASRYVGSMDPASKALALIPPTMSRPEDGPNGKALVRVPSVPALFDRDSGRGLALEKMPGPSRRVASLDPASKALALIPPTMSRQEDGPNGKALVRVPSVPPLFDRDSGRGLALGKMPGPSRRVASLDPASKALARVHPPPGTSRPARKPNAKALMRVPSAPPVFDRDSGRDFALGKLPRPSRRVGSIDPSPKALARIPPLFNRASGRDLALGELPRPSRRVGSIDPSSKALARIPPLFNRASGRDLALGELPRPSRRVGSIDPSPKELARIPPLFNRASGRDLALSRPPDARRGAAGLAAAGLAAAGVGGALAEGLRRRRRRRRQTGAGTPADVAGMRTTKCERLCRAKTGADFVKCVRRCRK